jgi:hypothetical protein
MVILVAIVVVKQNVRAIATVIVQIVRAIVTV